MQRSGTGSQMKRGLGGGEGRRVRRRERMLVTRLMQRWGEQMRWNDLDASRAGESRRSLASRRSFGVVYLKERYWVLLA